MRCLLEGLALLQALKQHGTEYFTVSDYWQCLQLILYLLTAGKPKEMKWEQMQKSPPVVVIVEMLGQVSGDKLILLSQKASTFHNIPLLIKGLIFICKQKIHLLCWLKEKVAMKCKCVLVKILSSFHYMSYTSYVMTSKKSVNPWWYICSFSHQR